MVAFVLSLVYRQMASLSEGLRTLQLQGMLWVAPLQVSKQALSKRLQTLPATVFAQVFSHAWEHHPSPHSSALIPPPWQPVWERFTAVWVADASTLEALKRKLKLLREQAKNPLGGKIMVLQEMLTHVPIKLWYTTNDKANERRWCQQLLEQLPVGGLLVFDLGFFKFAWFDQFTQNQKFFLTRLREKTAYKVTRTLGCGLYFRDEIVEMGQYRSDPCRHPVRLVSVLWGKDWYCYLTNVLDPQLLSAQQVCDLYRRRWSIEDSFRIVKRLLGLAYLWVGSTNGVEIQLLATWMVYTVLNDLCAEIAVALNHPLEVISLEMVFRACAHFAQALLTKPAIDLVSYLVEHYQLLGLVKQKRKRHRADEARSRYIWALCFP